MEYIVYNINGNKFVPLIQAEDMRRERDAALIANKNLNTMLNILLRSKKDVHNESR